MFIQENCSSATLISLEPRARLQTEAHIFDIFHIYTGSHNIIKELCIYVFTNKYLKNPGRLVSNVGVIILRTLNALCKNMLVAELVPGP